MCNPPINQHSGTMINDLQDIAERQRRIQVQCEASVGGGENPPQCQKAATVGRYCEEHTEE